jgi:hypothetical protein
MMNVLKEHSWDVAVGLPGTLIFQNAYAGSDTTPRVPFV